ncbi:hypothetical protein BC332_10200 [Capsicum chinense]|nr:hypothetical protein BC332_10200 [Capsicum chinense]
MMVVVCIKFDIWQFLPTRKVMEKAQKLRSTLTKEMLSGSTSTNILAMTFRQVTLQHLWNFELVLFIPGAERNMDDLETPREVLRDTDRFEFCYSFPISRLHIADCLAFWPILSENQGILSLAWRYSGVLPMYLKHAMDSKDSDLNSSSTPSEGTEDEMKAAAQDIASYQVVLSREGKIVEFQPTSRVAEYQWAANPLVKELYEKIFFVPGLIERGLKMITRPNDDVVLELLLSSNPQSSFAFLASLLQRSVVEEQPLFSGVDAKVALLKRKRDKYTPEL